MPGLHRRDHVVHGAALEGVHGRGPRHGRDGRSCGSPLPSSEGLAVPPGGTSPRPFATLSTSAVRLLTSPRPASVARPADAVARPELDLLGPVDLAATPAPADLLRFPGDLSRPFHRQASPLQPCDRPQRRAALRLSRPRSACTGDGTPPRRRPRNCPPAPSRRWCSPSRPAVPTPSPGRGCGPRGPAARGYGR